MEMIKENDRFVQLVEALERGWEIQEPVMLGALWRTTTGGNTGAYHFVLRHQDDQKTTLMSLVPSSQLLVFLAENNISVSAL
jgi:hypothetical protein